VEKGFGWRYILKSACGESWVFWLIRLFKKSGGMWKSFLFFCVENVGFGVKLVEKGFFNTYGMGGKFLMQVLMLRF